MRRAQGTPVTSSRPFLILVVSLPFHHRPYAQAGATHWIARRLVRMSGGSERRLIALVAVALAPISLFMSNLAAGALLLPSAIETSRRTGIKPGKLLIPVAYGSL